MAYDPIMAFQAVLFDAVGTLFHTRGSVGEIYGGVAHEFGSTASAARIDAAFARQFRHSGPESTAHEKEWWKDVVYRVFNELGMVRDFDRFFDKVYDIFRSASGWISFPETVETLRDLRARKLKLGVISNFDSRIYPVMRDLHILDFFDTVTISSETGFAKPSPQIFEAALGALQLPPSQVLLVGDSLHDDVEAAEKAGITGVLLDRDGPHCRAAHVRRISDLRQVILLLEQDNL